MSRENRLTTTLDRLFQDPENVTLSRSLFPEAGSAADIAAAVRRAVRQGLSVDIADCFSAELSIGAVFGCLLTDRSKVAVKFHLPSVSASHLQSVAVVQRSICVRGVPCPEVPTPPVFDGIRTVRFERWSTEGEARDRVSDTARDHMAHMLSWLVQEAGTCPEHAGLSREDWPDPLWPAPHNSLFDFDRTSDGAQWIDDQARTCREVIRGVQDTVVSGHMDWSLQHFRFCEDDSIAMIFDWDSLRLVPELRLVGSAAACFTLRNEPVCTPTPAPEAARAFVLAYERRRAAPFTAEQWRGISAAALYAVCYGARCEHALGGTQHTRFRKRIAELPKGAYF